MEWMSVQWFVGSKESCVQKIKELTQESKKGYAFWAIFETDRRDILAYRGAVCYLLGFIGSQGKLYAKNQEIRKI